MQLQCSKKVCKKHETCSKKVPKWEPKSTQILQKTRFKNVLTFRINFRRPLVPILLAKWSPTRRTSSRKPNGKGKLQGKGTPRTVFEAQHARGAGGTPGPERIFGPRSAQGPSKNDLRKGGWKKHETSIQQFMLFGGSEPRLALYSSLISHFRIF